MFEFVKVEGFDREQWSTVHVDRLKSGAVFRFRGDSENSVMWMSPQPYDDAAHPAGEKWVWFTTHSVETGHPEGASIVRANTSVLVRCDVVAHAV